VTRPKTKPLWVAALCGVVGASCGEMPEQEPRESQESIDETSAALTGADGHTIWPASGGVVSIPYELVKYDDRSNEGVGAVVEGEIRKALDYIQRATNQKVKFVSNPSAAQRLRFARRVATDTTSRASCGTGVGAPTTCVFRLSAIVAIAHRKSASDKPLRVYFSDGTARSTTMDDLQPAAWNSDGTLKAGTLLPEPVKFPTNPATGKAYTPDDVAAIDFNGPNVVAWYHNGYTSKGTELDLGSIAAPRPFTRVTYTIPTSGAPITAYMELLGVAVTPNAGKVYAFWLDPRKSASQPGVLHTVGTSSTDLVGDPANWVQVNAGEVVPGDILGMVYDETSTLNTYSYGKHHFQGNRGQLDALGFTKAPMYQVPDFVTAVHEITHGLGYEHEQQRKDRDDYVLVGSNTGNYLKQSGTPFGPYDLASIMQYGGTRKWEQDKFSNNVNSYSWRDVRSILAMSGVGDPQASPTVESATVASWTAAAKAWGAYQVYSPATGRLPSDIVGLDYEGDTGRIRSYYTFRDAASGAVNLYMSQGTTYDLGRYSLPLGPLSSELSTAKVPSAAGLSMAPADILGVALSDGESLTWFKVPAAICRSGVARTRGSYADLASVWPAACVTLPAGYGPDNIRDIARHRYGGATKFITLYDDTTYSVGGTTDLASDSGGTFSVTLPPEQELSGIDVHGFAINGSTAMFFLGCQATVSDCGGTAFRYVEVPDFVSRLPAQFR
jgi:hypothetical protein